MPLEAYEQDLKSQRIQLQNEVIIFIKDLLYVRKGKSIIPQGEDYEAVKLISSEIISRNGDFDYFLGKYDYINVILTRLLSDKDEERVTLVKTILIIMARLKKKIDQLMKDEFELLTVSESGGKRGKKTYKKRARSRKTHKKRVMSSKLRMRRSNRLRSKVLG